MTRHGDSDDEAFIELRRRSQHAQPQTARHRHRSRRTSLATAAIVTADVNDLDQARRRLGLSFYDLWVRYIGLGGHDDAFGVRSYLSGGPAISDGEHDRLVLALNEAFVDAGNGRPLSFRPRLNPHRAPHPGYRRVERTPEGSSLRYEHGDSISTIATPGRRPPRPTELMEIVAAAMMQRRTRRSSCDSSSLTPNLRVLERSAVHLRGHVGGRPDTGGRHRHSTLVLTVVATSGGGETGARPAVSARCRVRGLLTVKLVRSCASARFQR